ncbi:hypothetical protein CVT24_007911 [Panaeolus cyanescens]|uniref:Uncharacterized protein n=1 Tax=Panaeolus cyanescens TaxID=181874 RepID=A0A409W091_9AGAR|nr:hypothetical protein CVT24_007911 [Panaeolus cyanescens]
MATSAPPEVWNLIISHLKCPSELSTTLTKTLLSLSLTSPSLAPIAQSHLFASLSYSPSRQRSAHKAIYSAIQAKPWLIECVKDIVIYFPTPWKSEDSVFDDEGTCGIFELLATSSSVNLVSLTLSTAFSACTFSSLLRSPTSTSHKVLHSIQKLLELGCIRGLRMEKIKEFDLGFIVGPTGRLRRLTLEECYFTGCPDDDEDNDQSSNRSPVAPYRFEWMTGLEYLELSTLNLAQILDYLRKSQTSPFGDNADLSTSVDVTASSSSSSSSSSSPSVMPTKILMPPPLSLSCLTHLSLAIDPSLGPFAFSSLVSLITRNLTPVLQTLTIQVEVLIFYILPWATLDRLLFPLSSNTIDGANSNEMPLPLPSLTLLELIVLPSTSSAGWSIDIDTPTLPLVFKFPCLEERGVRVVWLAPAMDGKPGLEVISNC